MSNIDNDSWMFHHGQVIQFVVPENISLPIYVIGDSHVRILIDAAPYIFKSSQVDIEYVYISKTAYAIGSEKYLNDAVNNIPEGSNVLLSFGEIDCRHHIPKWAKINQTSIAVEVDKMFQRYIDNCVTVLVDKFNVSVMAAYVCPDDHNHENDYIDILKAKTYFNKLLLEYCESKGIVYIPLFEIAKDKCWDITDHDYPHYFNDTSHLGACMIPIILKSINEHE